MVNIEYVKIPRRDIVDMMQRIDRFAAECNELHQTDSEKAWELLNEVRAIMFYNAELSCLLHE